MKKEALPDEMVLDIECQKRRMFGAPVLFANRSMFAGVFGEDIFIRLGEEDLRRFSEENHGTRPFIPVEGRAMREYVIAPADLFEDREAFHSWLFLSSEYARGLRGRVTPRAGSPSP